ncbi:PadR family transcriptional regulator [Amycolatopsis sp. NPDC005003]
MWIEILLLSKLAVEPRHGYELRKAVEASTGHTLSNNSLYPTLRRFVDAGAVSRSAEEQEAKPPRHVYTITEVGRELLHDLLADFPADLALTEPEFLARVGNFAWLRPEERARVLEVRRKALSAEQERLAALAAGQADPWSRVALHHVLSRLDAELRWLADLKTDPREGA